MLDWTCSPEILKFLPSQTWLIGFNDSWSALIHTITKSVNTLALTSHGVGTEGDATCGYYWCSECFACLDRRRYPPSRHTLGHKSPSLPLPLQHPPRHHFQSSPTLVLLPPFPCTVQKGSAWKSEMSTKSCFTGPTTHLLCVHRNMYACVHLHVYTYIYR